MKKNRKIGRVEQEFIYKQGMTERLIEAYTITVKSPQEVKGKYDGQRTGSKKTTRSYLRKGVLI